MGNRRRAVVNRMCSLGCFCVEFVGSPYNNQTDPNDGVDEIE